MTLTDLILIQSWFLLDTPQKMIELIDNQPNSNLFLKSFMELDYANLLQIMCFESRIVIKTMEANTETYEDS